MKCVDCTMCLGKTGYLLVKDPIGKGRGGDRLYHRAHSDFQTLTTVSLAAYLRMTNRVVIIDFPMFWEDVAYWIYLNEVSVYFTAEVGRCL